MGIREVLSRRYITKSPALSRLLLLKIRLQRTEVLLTA